MTSRSVTPRCPECRGSGYTVERDWDGFHWRRYTCAVCLGTGKPLDTTEAA